MVFDIVVNHVENLENLVGFLGKGPTNRSPHLKIYRWVAHEITRIDQPIPENALLTQLVSRVNYALSLMVGKMIHLTFRE